MGGGESLSHTFIIHLKSYLGTLRRLPFCSARPVCSPGSNRGAPTPAVLFPPFREWRAHPNHVVATFPQFFSRSSASGDSGASPLIPPHACSPASNTSSRPTMASSPTASSADTEDVIASHFSPAAPAIPTLPPIPSPSISPFAAASLSFGGVDGNTAPSSPAASAGGDEQSVVPTLVLGGTRCRSIFFCGGGGAGHRQHNTSPEKKHGSMIRSH